MRKDCLFYWITIEIRGIDQLKMMVDDWLQELAREKQMAQQAAQAQMQNNPMVMRNNIEMTKIMQKEKEMEQKTMLDNKQFQLDLEQLKQSQIKVLADVHIAKTNSNTQRIKADAERYAKQVELAIKKKEMHHRHFREAVETHHAIHHANAQLRQGDNRH